MRTLVSLSLGILLVSLFAVLASPARALAASDQGACRQAVIDTLRGSSGEETVGDAISDGFYGNEPNTLSNSPAGPSEVEPGEQAGDVVPSQSPGPQVTNPDGSVRPGASWGDIQQTVIKPICNA